MRYPQIKEKHMENALRASFRRSGVAASGSATPAVCPR